MTMASMSIMVVVLMRMMRVMPACVDDNDSAGKARFDGHVYCIVISRLQFQTPE